MQGGIKSKSSGSGKKESDPDPQPCLPLLGSYLAYCGCEMMSGINIHTVPTGKQYIVLSLMIGVITGGTYLLQAENLCPVWPAANAGGLPLPSALPMEIRR